MTSQTFVSNKWGMEQRSKKGKSSTEKNINESRMFKTPLWGLLDITDRYFEED